MSTPSPPIEDCPSPRKGRLHLLLEAAAAADAVQGLLKAAIDPALESFSRNTTTRRPNEDEKRKGVPADFWVKSVTRQDGSGRKDKYFYTPDGTCFRSIVAVVRWLQENSASATDGAASRPAAPPTNKPVFRVFTNV